MSGNQGGHYSTIRRQGVLGQGASCTLAKTSFPTDHESHRVLVATLPAYPAVPVKQDDWHIQWADSLSTYDQVEIWLVLVGY